MPYPHRVYKSACFFVIAAAASLMGCQTDPCGDIDTLFVGTNQVCFSVQYTCSAPATVIQQTPCGGLSSDFALNIKQAASCTITVTCADGRVQMLEAYWTPNSQCVPVMVMGGSFSGTVCDVDGGLPMMDASPDTANDAPGD